MLKAGLSFSIAGGEEEEQDVLERVKEIIELLNMDKEEQTIEPDAYVGNLKDYPKWMTAAFENEFLIQELEEYLDYDRGELEDWELEDWYEDLAACKTYNFRMQPSDEPGRHLLIFDIGTENYGGDMNAMWMLLAAGATALYSIEPFEDVDEENVLENMEQDENYTGLGMDVGDMQEMKQQGYGGYGEDTGDMYSDLRRQ